MSAEFWAGLLAIPALGAACLILWALYSVATKAWRELHVAMLSKINLRPNPIHVFEEDDRPKYLESANRLRDAYLLSPRIYVLTGLGWHVAFVRDTKRTESKEPSHD